MKYTMEQATSVSDDVIALRRYLHQYPELSYQEEHTARFVAEKLNSYGLEVKTNVGGHGVLALLRGTQGTYTIGLRADMDALPVTEKTGLPYASQHEGVMHACGHDAHTAMLLRAAYELSNAEERLSDNVLFIFQPAEEASPHGGAQYVIADPSFQAWKPDVIFGQHVWPDLPAGKIGIRKKEMMGASDRIKVTFHGESGHASMPHQTHDTIVAASYFITALQTIVSRSVSPLSPAVVTLGTIEGGSAPNVIADEVTVKGTIRTYDKHTQQIIFDRIHELGDSLRTAFQVRADILYEKGYGATINEKNWAQFVKTVAQKELGEQSTPEIEPSLASEDFSYYLKKIPGAFFWLGTRDPQQKQKPLHDARFTLDENALPIGTKFIIQLVRAASKRLKKVGLSND